MALSRLEVQDFLTKKTFGDLAEEWGVYARVDAEGKKFSLNYDMLEYTPGHRPTEQCRGTVLRVVGGTIPNLLGKPDMSYCPGDTTILAYPFDKFYNEQEQFAAKIQWDRRSVNAVTIQDKLDGTLCILYYDSFAEKWCVATRSVPEANLPIDGRPGHTFTTLFEEGVWATFGEHFETWASRLPKSFTWMFELTSPYNRVFVNYKSTSVTLLGIRDNVTLKELDPDAVIASLSLQMPRPQVWSLRNLDDVRAFVNGRSPEECEGAVIVDCNYNRVKVKNIHWVSANATKTSLGTSPRNLMRYVLAGISDDITSMMPDNIKSEISQIQSGISDLFQQNDAQFKACFAEAAGDRKHFASLVSVRTTWVTPMFRMFEGKCSSTGEFVKDLVRQEKLTDTTVDFLLKAIKFKPHT